MDATDLGTAYSPRELDFLTEALECVRGGRYAMTDRFEGDGAELQVFRFIHLTHAALSYWANDAKTSKYELAWFEAGASIIQKTVEMSQRSIEHCSFSLFGLDKLFEMHFEFEIPATRRVYECCAILRILLQGGME
jgi:hypothetical protein